MLFARPPMPLPQPNSPTHVFLPSKRFHRTAGGDTCGSRAAPAAFPMELFLEKGRLKNRMPGVWWRARDLGAECRRRIRREERRAPLLLRSTGKKIKKNWNENKSAFIQHCMRWCELRSEARRREGGRKKARKVAGGIIGRWWFACVAAQQPGSHDADRGQRACLPAHPSAPAASPVRVFGPASLVATWTLGPAPRRGVVG